ncbi:MAG: hypothetical protein ACRDY1_11915, partial [Acidimicrobiales bacterium]
MRTLSLRSRLLLAVGAIALVSLVAADFTVYAALRSYLYRQTDQTLALSAGPVSHLADHGGPQGRRLPGGFGGPTFATPPLNASGFCQIGRESAPGMFIEVREADDKVVSGEECSAFVPGQKSYEPKLPRRITGLVPDPAPFGTPTAYFTVASAEKGGPSFRVLASTLEDGGTVVVAEPLTGTDSTLC